KFYIQQVAGRALQQGYFYFFHVKVPLFSWAGKISNSLRFELLTSFFYRPHQSKQGGPRLSKQ
ncbi:hypothetical protein ACTXOX_14130, partial [Pseudomonas helleri]|uniref:hypothetical protein n=1 Tax=Pseudomonas helleri TaxID=1608996 RepID=UPI003FD59E03